MLSSKSAVNAKTDVYGIIGNPVGHSLSPLIHNTLFREMDINAVYVAFQVNGQSLSLAFEGLRALGVRGVNITVPHKEAAVHLVDEIPEDIDRGIGAINTVVNQNGKLLGYNTDARGFLVALNEDLSFRPEGRTALVLGAGGAGRSVVFALARTGAERILLYDALPGRAAGLKKYLKGFFLETDIESPEGLASVFSERIDLVVNATPVGMNASDLPPVDLNRLLSKPQGVYDLVYSPAETPLLRVAKQLGLPCSNGLGMLAAQAALSFELWTGKKQGVRERMLEALKTCRF